MLSSASKFTGMGLCALLGGAVFIAACDSGGDDDDQPSAGSSNGGSSAGSATGGSAGATAGSTTAGTSVGGEGGGGLMTYDCQGIKPPSAAITDFTDLMPEAAPLWGATPEVNAFYGGLFSYGAVGAAPVTDVSGGNLHVTGTIKDYSGSGLYVAYCTDASAFDGVRFTISGDAGPSKKVSFFLQTNSNLYPDPAAMKGECTDATEATKFTACSHPFYSVTVGAEPVPVEITWAKLTGGLPAAAATTTGKDIVGFSWVFAWAASGTPYDVDVTIDDVEFIGQGDGTAGAGAGGDSATGGAGGGK
jgi:hypothetical protein